MVRLIAALVPLVLLGCDGPQMQQRGACEEAILRDIPSPGTYKQIEVSTYEVEGTPMVHVTFDSQNIYGALVRDDYFCEMSADRTEVVKLIGGIEVKRGQLIP